MSSQTLQWPKLCSVSFLLLPLLVEPPKPHTVDPVEPSTDLGIFLGQGKSAVDSGCLLSPLAP